MRYLSLLIVSSVMVSQLALAAPHHRVKHTPQVKQQRPLVVDINKATAKQFSAVKGVGPKRAAAIVAYRKQHGHFNSVSGLTAVKGIGKKFLARIAKQGQAKLIIGNS